MPDEFELRSRFRLPISRYMQLQFLQPENYCIKRTMENDQMTSPCIPRERLFQVTAIMMDGHLARKLTWRLSATPRIDAWLCSGYDQDVFDLKKSWGYRMIWLHNVGTFSCSERGFIFFGLKRSHQLPSDWHYKLLINGTTFRGAINHGLRCLQLRLVTWCVPMEKIAVEMHPPFFFSYKTSFFSPQFVFCLDSFFGPQRRGYPTEDDNIHFQHFLG